MRHHLRRTSVKKLIPLLILIISFTGFLATQIVWDNFSLNAQNETIDKQKHSVFEKNFNEFDAKTILDKNVVLKNETSPIIILNFWASWCLPCLKEFPSLVAFQNKYKDVAKVVGINGDEEDTLLNIKKIEKKYGLNFESIDDSKSILATKFLVNSYPVSIVFHKGKVIYVSKKIHDFMNPEFLSLIDSALGRN
jgi:thiol-disulfide isomerase/thioredoxin